jgi:DNA-binding transcriptional MocR family regulator
VSKQYLVRSTRASGIARELEAAIREGRLTPGERLPTVRSLASALGVSPVTVASAYRELRTRGMVTTAGRRGTQVSARPPLAPPGLPPPPAGTRDLSSGNPDPALLPPHQPALRRLRVEHRLYTERPGLPRLLELGAAEFGEDRIEAGSLAVVGGALDGIERVLEAHLRPGDRVAVEDPGFPRVFDLIRALGLVPEPVAVDNFGPMPHALERALASGPRALILTPRAQNPTGAALDERRARQLRTVLRDRPKLLLIEDDHAGAVAGEPALTLCDRDRQMWAVVRSFSKPLGPDLRLALVAGDPTTIARVLGRQLLGPGWVSHVLQGLAVELLSAAETGPLLRRARETYSARRAALIEALAARGIEARGRSGLNVWVPVPDEVATVGSLQQAGWAVAAGHRFRLRSPSAVRVTVATLSEDESERFASDLAHSLRPEGRTYAA